MPTHHLPFVSVIVPCYNAGGAIQRTLRSILAQDYPADRYEIIVADNGSSDETAMKAAELGVRVVRADRAQGSYVARNDGVRQAQGELLAFCDADETASPEWLRSLVEGLATGYGGVAGPILAKALDEMTAVERYAVGDAEFRSHDEPGDILFAPTGNVLYRREVFDALGGFREDTLTGADYDFSYRVTRDLGLRIRFVPAAAIWHEPRKTLGALLRHEARISYGREWVCERHGVRRPSLIALAAELVLGTASSFGAAAVAVLKHGPGTVARRRSAFILINPLMKCANAYGRLHYRAGLSLPRNW